MKKSWTARALVVAALAAGMGGVSALSFGAQASTCPTEGQAAEVRFGSGNIDVDGDVIDWTRVCVDALGYSVQYEVDPWNVDGAHTDFPQGICVDGPTGSPCSGSIVHLRPTVGYSNAEQPTMSTSGGVAVAAGGNHTLWVAEHSTQVPVNTPRQCVEVGAARCANGTPILPVIP